MLIDTLNKAVPLARVDAFGFTLWCEMRAIAHKIVLIAVKEGVEEMWAHMGALDELDPHTLKGLAWQMIKVWANGPE